MPQVLARLQAESKLMRALDPAQRARRGYELALVAGLLVIALLIRKAMLGHQDADYDWFLKPWYDFIESHGGMRALKHDFADYNAPYLYILAALTYVPIDPLNGIKLVSIVFDFVMAFTVYKILRLRFSSYELPVIGALAVLFLPTVVLNSSMWGQCDVIFTTFSLLGLYYLLKERPWLACIFFGVSYAFKQQAVFLFPLLFFALLAGRVKWRNLLAIPAVFILLDLPAIVLGADPDRLLLVYVRQTDTYDWLTAGAPTFFRFFSPNNSLGLARTFGIGLAAAAVLLMGLVVLHFKSRLSSDQLIALAATSAIAIPFFLPGMHERYFYLADVVSLIAAFWLPRKLWFLPLLVQFASLMSYTPHITGTDAVPVIVPALVMFGGLVVATHSALHELRVSTWRPAYPGAPGQQPKVALSESESERPRRRAEGRSMPDKARTIRAG
ncbi:MAG: DUF2029 domain-containing protein [Corynebacteriales bacterium]|nr:DUF2029 domain-containing protein [Mycobacteriales bacterium]